MRTIIHGALVSTLLLLTGLLEGCNADYGRHLPNGYAIYCTNGYTTVIDSPRVTTIRRGNTISRKSTVVESKVVGIAVHGALVIGLVEASPNSELGPGTPGYFIVDTATDEVSVGLNETEWTARLSEMGITDVDLGDPRWLPGAI
jgi:hypothetical protein